MLSGKALLITGGTGSFGRKFVEIVLSRYPKIRRLVVFSRDELKQFEMSQVFPTSRYPQIRYFVGDVRDKERLRRAMEDIDVVVHAAALKQVPACEYNPFEAIKTNILGAQNVIDCCLECGIQKVVALSTDKAAAPINLYGATKLCSDRLFISANNIKGRRDIKFAVVRYGNVIGSRGSVIPFFLAQRKHGILPITDERMTRFNITLEEGVDLVLYALTHMWGGELYVPKIPSYRITDVAKAIAPEARLEIVGIRPGEKLHEEMITETDSLNTIDCGRYYVIVPAGSSWDINRYVETFSASRVPLGFHYSSGTNNDWLTIDQIRSLIATHVDSTFEVTTLSDNGSKRQLTVRHRKSGDPVTADIAAE